MSLLLSLVLPLIQSLVLVAPQAQAAPPTPAELHALETFDAAWEIIDTQHFDPNFNGVDWPAVRAELRPRAAAAQDRAELRRAISAMLERLGQSHFQLIPAEFLGTGAAGSLASPAGTCGLDLRWIDGIPVTIEVAAGGSAEAEGVLPGWQLASIDGEGLESRIAQARKRPGVPEETSIWKVLLAAVDGEVGSRVELGFTDANGAPHTAEIERRERVARAFDLPGLPTFFLSWHARRIEREGRAVGLLGFSNWLRPLLPALDKALAEMRDCDGIVLDLRGNTGGDGSVTTDVAGHFFDRETSLGVMRMRHGSRPFLVRPRGNPGGWRVEPYLGPLAILVDETTGSSSEVFAGGMQSLGRARVFGTRTVGAALPATLTRLPNGDSLMHAIGEFATARGDVLEGDGVRPDELVPRTRADAIADRDPALEAALAWIGRSLER